MSSSKVVLGELIGPVNAVAVAVAVADADTDTDAGIYVDPDVDLSTPTQTSSGEVVRMLLSILCIPRHFSKSF